MSESNWSWFLSIPAFEIQIAIYGESLNSGNTVWRPSALQGANSVYLFESSSVYMSLSAIKSVRIFIPRSDNGLNIAEKKTQQLTTSRIRYVKNNKDL